VFKFKLVAVPDEMPSTDRPWQDQERRRIIPTAVKVEVWNRDKGRCRISGATDELHFDHILPYSKGGASLTAENVQLLCARHNLAKGARII
jgi:5-methylcytosine-specific restriction endonuclease McrA